MKKRTLAMLMSACMVFGLLTGCSKKDSKASDSPSPSDEVTESVSADPSEEVSNTVTSADPSEEVSNTVTSADPSEEVSPSDVVESVSPSEQISGSVTDPSADLS